MGIGADNVYLIDTDEAGKMDMKHLGMQTLEKRLIFNYHCMALVDCGSEHKASSM